MTEKSFDEFVNDVLIPYVKSDFIRSDDVFEAMDEKKAEFKAMLNDEQKKKFRVLCRLSYRYCELLKQECFSDGLLKGLNADENEIEQDFFDSLI